MSNYKTVPNQKVVKVSKAVCNNEKKENYYARINLAAMDAAALNLDAGAFKLWIYFAKNQDNFEFALSSKAVESTFGMKIKQYNNAITKLTEAGYLVNTKGNNYIFNEIPVISKGNNDVITKEDNAVNSKGNNQLLPKDIRNTTHTTNNTTKNITESSISTSGEVEILSMDDKRKGNPGETVDNPIPASREWLLERYNLIFHIKDGIYKYANKFYVISTSGVA